jgi:hypothetical protein
MVIAGCWDWRQNTRLGVPGCYLLVGYYSSEVSPKFTRPVKAEDISCQPPLLNLDVFGHINNDDSAVVAKMVYLLQDQVLYQRLLACRGTDAQTLLDLLQDVSNIMVLLPSEY